MHLIIFLEYIHERGETSWSCWGVGAFRRMWPWGGFRRCEGAGSPRGRLRSEGRQKKKKARSSGVVIYTREGGMYITSQWFHTSVIYTCNSGKRWISEEKLDQKGLRVKVKHIKHWVIFWLNLCFCCCFCFIKLYRYLLSDFQLNIICIREQN